MEKEFDKENALETVETVENTEEASVNAEAETEQAADEVKDPPKSAWKAYVPRFTEASERYRVKGDSRIRERFGIKTPEYEMPETNPDEIKLDATAEFDEDFMGSEAKTPENIAVDESDESISVFKFASAEDELDAEAEKEREEIKKLLRSTATPTDEVKEEAETEETAEPEVETEAEEQVSEESDGEYVMPDPDDDFGVYDFAGNKPSGTEDAPEGADDTPVTVNPAKTKKGEIEFTNPAQRDSFKDKFLDTIISKKIRLGASLFFGVALLLLEILSATKLINIKLLEESTSYALLGIADFLLAACIFVMTLPEIFRAVKNLFAKKLTPELLPLPAFIVLGAYTLALCMTGASSYALFGLLFATITIPVISGALYRAKADFIAFKMASQPDDKEIIDRKNTRELGAENIALDGAIDEYKSKIARTFSTSFISDFYKNTAGVRADGKHIGLIYGVPFGVGLVAGVAAYFLTFNVVTAISVLALTVMLGCPAFAILSSKASYFHTQRAALLSDSAAIGEDAYDKFSSVDVFAFDDTDIFGPDDVNLKRFMLYGERDSMEKVMRQMCALFAAVGGPLDCMFSAAIDNRVRHKTATNVIIEDDGICGEVAGHMICAGSEEYMRRNGIAIPAAAVTPERGVSLDTTKIMYASEDGEVYAKFYIRYSFSEEFTSALPSLREAGIIPLVYTRDPNVSTELLSTLTAGADDMRVLKVYAPLGEHKVYSRVSASMVTYGDKLDAASMIVLSKKHKLFSLNVKFAELCATAMGMILAIALSLLGFTRITALVATLWQILMCMAVGLASRKVFLSDAKKMNEEQ
jgi:cation transport ATPase